MGTILSAGRLRLVALLVAMLALAPACRTTSTGAPDLYRFTAESPAARDFADWLAGDYDLDDPERQAALAAILHDPAATEARFVAAEAAYWAGDTERAFELLVAMLHQDLHHRLGRLAVARLYDLQSEVDDYHARLHAALTGVSFEGLEPPTRAYLSMLGQVAALEVWRRSDADTPFDAAALGLPTRWQMTPVHSPWRLLDFDTPFEVEREPHLAARYRSPQLALDEPANYKPTRTYAAPGITLEPDAATAGIYYLETFATVDADRPQDYWIYADFPSAAVVWIGGVEVVRHEERGYEPSKRYRHVRLSPGTHRVLIKLALQPGYRDWFDLTFLNDRGAPLSGSRLTFSHLPPAARTGSAAAARAPAPTMLSELLVPAQVERLLVAPEHVAQASDVALYAGAVVAHGSGANAHFDAALGELRRRFDGFAPGYALESMHVQTLWEVPAELREARVISLLRQAHALEEENLHVLVRLGRWLRSRGNDREVRALLETARDRAFRDGPDGTPVLRNAAPLVAWAHYLDSRGWSDAAERAWRRVLDASPASCQAATSLQALYYARNHYPALETITPRPDACPPLVQRELAERPDRRAEHLELLRREAARYPYSADHQLRYARALVRADRRPQATAVLEAARERLPDNTALVNELADHLLATDGNAAAARLLRDAMEAHGRNGLFIWRLATLEGRIPLEGLMPDGYRAAMQAARAGSAEAHDEAQAARRAANAADDAYYVVDFAAREVFPDGAAITLTHTVVRVMTKGAIDRYAETDIPANARLLLARTIKADGSVRAPEDVSGKAALSMPGLAEGDFVEIAYLQFQGPTSVASHLEDIRFFFQMQNISTLHSEYVLLGAEGANFMLQNGAPRPEPIEVDGVRGVRFAAHDNPRPRTEPYSVSAFEYLPWIQAWRAGVGVDVLDADRRYVTEALVDSLRPGPSLASQVARWLGRDAAALGRAGGVSDADVERLFYAVSQWIPEPSQTAFGTEASHALLTRRGSPFVLLKAALDLAGVRSEIFLVKTRNQIEEVYPVGEFTKYRKPVLRVELPGSGRPVWLSPSGPDAMYGALDADVMGQPAVCVSCEAFVTETVPADVPHRPVRDITIEAALDADGTLRGTAAYTFHGARAVSVRTALRTRPDETARQKFFEAVLAELVSGATLTDATIDHEADNDRPVVLRLSFERPRFAREGRVETHLFREPLAALYAQLPARTIGLFVGYEREHTATLRLELPPDQSPRLLSRSGRWELPSPFGHYTRSVELDGTTLVITTSTQLPIQRVSPSDYPAFQQWANAVEQSSVLLLE